MASQNIFSIFIALIFIPFILAADSRGDIIDQIHKLQNMTIDEYINFVNPPAVQKFQNINGQTVLCVKYEDQISLRSGNISNNFTNSTSSIDRCPDGSVPILEITREIVQSFGSVRQFLNSRINFREDDGYYHVFAVVQTTTAQEVHGIKASLNIWQPFVQTGDAFSLSEITLSNGGLENIEVGWQVFPKRYNSSRVTFFIYYTLDGYYTGCFNLECKGFIQEGQFFYPGMPLDKPSVYGGPQMELVISIKRETRHNNTVWALYIRDILVGHWPTMIFNNLTLYANRADIGGELSVATTGSEPTVSRTDMGSGHFSKGNFGKAAFIRNIQLLSDNGTLISDINREYYQTNQNCYDATWFVTNSSLGDQIYFGGPGSDVPQCKI